MGKRWRKYSVGKYRLGALNGQAVVCWTDEQGKDHRRRLGVAASEIDARALLDSWVSDVQIIRDKKAKSKAVAELWAAYRADRQKDGKVMINFDNDWKPLGPRFGALEVDAITADICRDYAAERERQGKSVSTTWTELTRLRSCPVTQTRSAQAGVRERLGSIRFITHGLLWLTSAAANAALSS